MSTIQKEIPTKERMYVAILAAIQFSHIVDFVIMMPLGPTLMQDFSISPAQFAGLVSAYNFTGAFAGVIFSTIADRFDRKLLLAGAMVGFVLGTFLCGLSNGYAQLLAARIFTGCFGGVLNALVMTVATDLVPFERRGRALGVIMSSFSIASVIGVPLGLAIADFWGWKWSFHFIAFFGLLVGILAQIVIPSISDHVHKAKIKESLLRFYKILTHAEYFKAHSLIFILGFSMFMIIPFLSPYAVKNIGIKTTELKYLYLVGGACTVVTARLIGKWTDQIGAFKVFMTLILISTMPILIYTNAGPMSLGHYLLMTTFFMTIISGRMIPCMTLISQVPESKDRGSFMGVLNSIRSLGTASATMVGGLIIGESASGELTNFGYAGFLAIGLTLLTIPMANQLEKLRAFRQFSER